MSTWKETVARIKMIRIFFQWFWTIIYNSSHPLGPVVVQFFLPTDGAIQFTMVSAFIGGDLSWLVVKYLEGRARSVKEALEGPFT